MQSPEKVPLQCLKQHSPCTDVSHSDGPPTITSTSDNGVASQPAKRPTRQWAAWTREEEESFFTALRQVGKNFEKITCRVQSKNKDQVRHYYYRLVRRMNKLLGPDLCLDAKNSKDTNAAMLRWWSLLEKYSCKASKLHLKPRRFKTIVETLENQLMKDRKKNVKKQALQGENHSSSLPTATNQNKLSANDARAVKIVLVDSQNGQKVSPGKGPSTRRCSSIGVIRSSNKGEPSHKKPSRQRRKSGAVTAAALKRWEKAAMAGVSLVADAAEHLERTAGENCTFHQGQLNCTEQTDLGPSMQEQVNLSNISKSMAIEDHVQATMKLQLNCTEQTDLGPSVQEQVNLSNISKSMAIEDNVQATMKLKLQLFPIDQTTRKALEMDKRNPFLELTLSTRKKISSILEHLDRKWGNSSVASGELMLFPSNIQRENLVRYQRWTRDSDVTAAEVYAVIGSPAVFRLRYGWISSTELQSRISQTTYVPAIDFEVQESRRQDALREQSLPQIEEKSNLEKLAVHFLGDQQTLEKQKRALKESAVATFGEANKNADVELSNDIFEMHNLGSSVLSKKYEPCDESNFTKFKTLVDQRARKSTSLSTREWADSLTNASVGELLTEDVDVMDANGVENPAFRSSQCVEAIPFTCDSFDAAIAAHIYRQSKIGFSGPSTHSSSIWDAEETCDAFSFQNRAVPNNQVLVATSIADSETYQTSPARTGNKVQDEAMVKGNVSEDPMDECASETHETGNSAKDFSSLTDIYWPDSLGPLELDIPSCKYYSEDLILSDSLSGLNRLLASSLDAFQNCPFFGLDEKRPPSPTTGTQGGASFAGKIDKSDKAGVQSLQV
ncbi:TSL-kinase interacting protein 1-like isoform X1 [Chenopodium quinoa]|uniref:TSL-kinase interacting protein 1-like isoform X1 n=1 Tax=Chenopodium quinoa TaxID=63459 RepID=UPI000B789C30|nr:TSL-kinase interacting protein 1-like isoform X1 [Chenopodium quinoa]